MRLLLIVTAVLALHSGVQALVLCTTPDGTTYAGDSPPPGCVERKIGSAGGFVGRHDSSYDPPGVEPDSLEAAQIRGTNACRKGILQELKTPSTAKFVEPLEVSHTGGWNFAMSGDVDSQTAEGATLRTHFTCEAHFVGGDQWKMKIQLGDNAWPMVKSTPDGATLRKAVAAEVERRRHVQAVVVQHMENKPYLNGRFIEGTVANGATFPVYRVRICFDAGLTCQYTAPPMLLPGAQATFAIQSAGIGVPEWKITWDVVPDAR